MRLADYLDTLSWSKTDLAREAKLSPSTVSRAMKAETVSRPTAKAICTALSKGLRRPIALADVTELHITSIEKRHPVTSS